MDRQRLAKVALANRPFLGQNMVIDPCPFLAHLVAATVLVLLPLPDAPTHRQQVFLERRSA